MATPTASRRQHPDNLALRGHLDGARRRRIPRPRAWLRLSACSRPTQLTPTPWPWRRVQHGRRATTRALMASSVCSPRCVAPPGPRRRPPRRHSLRYPPPRRRRASSVRSRSRWRVRVRRRARRAARGRQSTIASTSSGHGVDLADVGGLEEVKAELERKFLAPMRNAELRSMYRKSLRGGLLLYGPPRCGKTFLARAIAGELDAQLHLAADARGARPLVGHSESNLHAVFERARRNAPARCSSTSSTPSATSVRTSAARRCATWSCSCSPSSTASTVKRTKASSCSAQPTSRGTSTGASPARALRPHPAGRPTDRAARVKILELHLPRSPGRCHRARHDRRGHRGVLRCRPGTGLRDGGGVRDRGVHP